MKKTTFSFSMLLIVAVFIGAGCTSSGSSSTTSTGTATESTNPQVAVATSSITMEEVAQHNSADDCWMVLDGNVYDVSEYVRLHPGGKEITRGCGIDATRFFNGEGHSATAKAIRDKYNIGTLAQ